MESDDRHRITTMLRSLEQGADGEAGEKLLPLVYDELRRQARAMMSREKAGHTLQATALVHEAFLRVAGDNEREWDGRNHFFAAAAEAMRRILINQARRKGRIKHGGEFKRADIEEAELPIEAPTDDVLIVDEALQQLESVDPRARQIVNLRYFAGFTVKETAEAMELSVSTIEAEWRFIRAWLKDKLETP